MEKAAAMIVITGRVQGVWYRGSTQDVARELGLTGWVRNVPTGEVEAFVEGPREKVEQLIAWCRKGPPFARVESVEVTWTEPEDHAGFFVKR